MGEKRRERERKKSIQDKYESIKITSCKNEQGIALFFENI